MLIKKLVIFCCRIVFIASSSYYVSIYRGANLLHLEFADESVGIIAGTSLLYSTALHNHGMTVLSTKPLPASVSLLLCLSIGSFGVSLGSIAHDISAFLFPKTTKLPEKRE